MSTCKLANKFLDAFNELPEDDKATTIQRIKSVNSIDDSVDISKDMPLYLMQDMLFNIVDDAFKTVAVMEQLVEKGIPSSLVEKESMNEDNIVGFNNGTALALSVLEDVLLDSPVLKTFIGVLESTDLTE